MSNVCANCNSPDLHLMNQFTILDEARAKVEIKVKYALGIIFEDRINLDHVEENKVELCSLCLSVFVQLYRFYIEFTKLSQLNSYLSSVLLHPPHHEREASSVLQSFNQIDDDNHEMLIKTEVEDEQEEEILSSSSSPCRLIINDYYSSSNNQDQQQEEEEEEKYPYKSKLRTKTELQCDKEAVLIIDKIDLNSSEFQRFTRSKVTKSKPKQQQPKLYPCDKCTASFPNTLQLKYHESSTHKPTKRKKIVVKKPKRRTKAQRYADTRKFKTYSCSPCNLTFIGYKASLRHRKLVHPKQIYTCSVCSKEFPFAYTHAYHYLTVHGQGELLPGQQCPDCPKYFSKPSYMKNHYLLVHQNKGKFPCSQCSTACATQQLLNTHISNVHDPANKANMCEICGKIYSNPFILKTHIKEAHLDPPCVHTCAVCGKTFAKYEYLSYHTYRLHNEERRIKNVPCTECDKLFFDEKSMRRHIRGTHRGRETKPYACVHCGVRFAQQSTMNRHALYQHSSKDVLEAEAVQCELCGKEFKGKAYLRQHLRSKSHGGAGNSTIANRAAAKAKAKLLLSKIEAAEENQKRSSSIIPISPPNAMEQQQGPSTSNDLQHSPLSSSLYYSEPGTV